MSRFAGRAHHIQPRKLHAGECFEAKKLRPGASAGPYF
jgi:hypothetical protein